MQRTLEHVKGVRVEAGIVSTSGSIHQWKNDPEARLHVKSKLTTPIPLFLAFLDFLAFFKGVTRPGYTRDRLRKNFLEVLLTVNHSKTRQKQTSKKAPNFLEVPLCPFPRSRLVM